MGKVSAHCDDRSAPDLTPEIRRTIVFSPASEPGESVGKSSAMSERFPSKIPTRQRNGGIFPERRTDCKSSRRQEMGCRAGNHLARFGAFGGGAARRGQNSRALW